MSRKKMQADELNVKIYEQGSGGKISEDIAKQLYHLILEQLRDDDYRARIEMEINKRERIRREQGNE